MQQSFSSYRYNDEGWRRGRQAKREGRGEGKAEQGWGVEAAGGMGSYEGEVIQLLSNLGATLLGGEPLVGGKLVLPALSPFLQSSHDKVKFVSKLTARRGD